MRSDRQIISRQYGPSVGMNTVDTYTNQVSNVWQCPIEVSAVIMIKRKEVRCVSNFKKFQILSVTSGTQNQELYHTSLHEPSELRIIDVPDRFSFGVINYSKYRL